MKYYVDKTQSHVIKIISIRKDFFRVSESAVNLSVERRSYITIDANDRVITDC